MTRATSKVNVKITAIIAAKIRRNSEHMTKNQQQKNTKKIKLITRIDLIHLIFNFSYFSRKHLRTK